MKLNDPKTSFKTYWSKTFYNGKKIPLIPPLLVNNCLIVDFKVKADFFNKFFCTTSTPLENSTNIPKNQLYFTHAKLDSIQFNDNEILKAIRNLYTNKAHGHEDITIRMIKLCNSSVVKPLSMIFKNCVRVDEFLNLWEKSNICPIRKKNNKQITNN